MNQFANKRASASPTYEPKISKKSQVLANQRREKLFLHAQERDIDIVQILLHPNNVEGDTNRLERVKKQVKDKEDQELTLHPKTFNRRKNEELLGKKMASTMSTGDRNVDLFLKSREHEKRDKESEEYWFERNADELKFHPEINNKVYMDRSQTAPTSIQDIRGTDKYNERLAKAREEAAFKKKMTERSGFSATQGIQKARKQVQKP